MTPCQAGFACSSWPWMRWMPGPLTFLLRVSFCAGGTEGLLCVQGGGTAPGIRGCWGRALRQQRGRRPRCHRVLCCSHGHPRCTTPAKAPVAAGDKGHSPGHPLHGFSMARTPGTVSSQLPPLLTWGDPKVSLHPRTQCRRLGWGRWRCNVLERCEVCHKMGLRLLVWAASSTSPCLTPESLCSPQWRQQLFAPSRR